MENVMLRIRSVTLAEEIPFASDSQVRDDIREASEIKELERELLEQKTIPTTAAANNKNRCTKTYDPMRVAGARRGAGVGVPRRAGMRSGERRGRRRRGRCQDTHAALAPSAHSPHCKQTYSHLAPLSASRRRTITIFSTNKLTYTIT